MHYLSKPNEEEAQEVEVQVEAEAQGVVGVGEAVIEEAVALLSLVLGGMEIIHKLILPLKTKKNKAKQTIHFWEEL